MHILKQTDDGGIQLIEQATGESVLTLTKRATVARTDTTAKNLFTIPKGAIPTALRVYSTTASNAASTATLSIGKTGTAAHYLSAFDIKTTGTGSGLQDLDKAVPLNLFVVGSATASLQIIGTYAETGTASTTGGPWTVEMDYYVP